MSNITINLFQKCLLSGSKFEKELSEYHVHNRRGREKSLDEKSGINYVYWVFSIWI